MLLSAGPAGPETRRVIFPRGRPGLRRANVFMRGRPGLRCAMFFFSRGRLLRLSTWLEVSSPKTRNFLKVYKVARLGGIPCAQYSTSGNEMCTFINLFPWTRKNMSFTHTNCFVQNVRTPFRSGRTRKKGIPFKGELPFNVIIFAVLSSKTAPFG